MTTLTNSFEGGTGGTTITAGNSGAGSGNAFDAVTGPPASGTLAFDSTEAAHGSLSCKLATGATSGQDLVRWSTSMGTQSQVWFRTYLYVTANPAVAFRPVGFATGGGSNCGQIFVNTTGKISFSNAAGTSVITSATTIPLNAWFRLEGFIIGSATVGQLEFKLFDTPDSATPTETQTSAASQNTNGPMGLYSYGITSALANVTAFWMDDLGLSNIGYIGPVPVFIPPQAPQQIPPGFISPASVFFTWRPAQAAPAFTSGLTGKAAAAGVFAGGKVTADQVTGTAGAAGSFSGVADSPQLIYYPRLPGPVVRPVSYASLSLQVPFAGYAAATGTVTGAPRSQSSVTGAAAAAGTMAGQKQAAGQLAGSVAAAAVITGHEAGLGAVSGQAAASGVFAARKTGAGAALGYAGASFVSHCTDTRRGTALGYAAAYGATFAGPQPGFAGVAAASGTMAGRNQGAVVFTTGTPYFRWAAGTPYLS